MLTGAHLAAPEVVGVLGWWCVVLGTPVVLLRRRRRRSRTAQPPPSGLLPSMARGRAGDPNPLRPATGAEENQEITARARAREAAGRWLDDELGAEDSLGPGSGDRAAAACQEMFAPGRVVPRTLEPLCRYVDFRRRLGLAVSELERRLARLPADRWRIEPYPLTGERRNTLLVIGETGVFVISATYAPGHWDDVIAVHRLTAKIELLLPGYRGFVQPAICHPFSVIRPRRWHRPDEHGEWVGAWLLGGDSVIEWLEHFGPEHGLNVGDLACFDRLAKPNWLTGAIPAPPSWPPIGTGPSPAEWE
jgi:hypothetical protein